MNWMLNIALVAIMIASVGCAKTAVHTAHNNASNVAVAAELALPEVAIPRIYFPFASDIVQPEAAQGIERNINWLQLNSSAYIILEGHCDEVGPSEYNMELGDRRARAVKSYLIEQGIPAERVIMVVSYGSTRPLNPGHKIEDLRENRRVEFVIR